MDRKETIPSTQWTEYYKNFTGDRPEFIRENSDDNENLNFSLPDEDIITELEVRKAYNTMKSGRYPGSK